MSARPPRILHPDHIGGDDCLHIGRPAAPQVVAFDPRLELGVVGIGLDDVEMAAEHHGRPGPARKPGQDGREPALVDDPDLEIGLLG